jgi:predicted ATPase
LRRYDAERAKRRVHIRVTPPVSKTPNRAIRGDAKTARSFPRRKNRLPVAPRRGENRGTFSQETRGEPVTHDGVDPTPSARGLLEPGTVVGDEYRIDGWVGGGAMGDVYRATQLRLDRTVALKLVRRMRVGLGDELLARFRREALAVAQLRHPGIVAIYDYGADERAGLYLVMEYLEGRSLRAELRRRGPLPVAEAVGLMRQICFAVQAAHESRIVHRDLKPENVFLTGDVSDGEARVRVLDFGLAKLSDVATTFTQPGVMMGTPLYMSPEQCEAKPADERADVYALGCIAFELLTGRPPFEAETLPALVFKHVYEAPVWPSRLRPGLSVAVDTVVLRALAKRPDARFETAAGLGRALAAAAGLEPAYTPDGTPALTTQGRAALEATVMESVGRETAFPNNLPETLTSFVGREAEVEAVADALARSRLVTLKGPGGIGKTRLALRIASRVMRAFPDGVWLAELASVSDPALVPAAVATALGTREEGAEEMPARLATELRSKRLLLVLDNCEHVADASAGLVGALLRASPGLRVLATSREVLGVQGESVWDVPPLGLPAAGDAGEIDCEAVRLFAERARVSRPTFAMTEQVAPAVAAICRKLDGIPLAIELAAARTKLLSVEQISAKLEDRFRLLAGPGRASAARQRTLRATVDWSYELLDETEASLLRRLSVFAGGWALEAAEAICSPESRVEPAGDAAESDMDPTRHSGAFQAGSARRLPSEVLRHLERLVDKSFVVAGETGDVARYRMLETIREYSREKLSASGEEWRVAEAHRDWYLALAERARGELEGAKQARWLRMLGLEHDNLRAALRWSLRDERDGEAGLRFVAALYRFWMSRGHLSEARHWGEAAFALADGAAPALRGDAWFALAVVSVYQTDFERAAREMDECLALRRMLGDEAGVVAALSRRALVANQLGEYAVAQTVLEEALPLARRIGSETALTRVTFDLGLSTLAVGDLERARDYFMDALAGYRAAGHTLGTATTAGFLGEVYRVMGDFDRAEACLAEGLTTARELDYTNLVADSVTALGRLHSDRGDAATALEHFRDARRLYETSRYHDGFVDVIESCALAAARAGDARRAVALEAAAAAARETTRAPRFPYVDAELKRLLAPALSALSAEEIDEARARGRALPLSDALDLGLGDPAR